MLFIRLALVAWLGALLGQPCALAAKFINSFAGPYIAYPIAFPACKEGESWNGRDQLKCRLLSHFNPARPRDLLAYEGNFSLASEFTDTAWLRVTVATRSNNQWKQNAFIYNFPVGGCSAFRNNMPAIFEHLTKTSAWSHGPCVVPVGFYQVKKGAKMNWTFPNLPILPYGHWLFQARSGHRGNTVAEFCWQVEGKTIPKV